MLCVVVGLWDTFCGALSLDNIRLCGFIICMGFAFNFRFCLLFLGRLWVSVFYRCEYLFLLLRSAYFVLDVGFPFGCLVVWIDW